MTANAIETIKPVQLAAPRSTSATRALSSLIHTGGGARARTNPRLTTNVSETIMVNIEVTPVLFQDALHAAFHP